MARCAEGHPLRRVRDVRRAFVVGAQERVDVNQLAGLGALARVCRPLRGHAKRVTTGRNVRSPAPAVFYASGSLLMLPDRPRLLPERGQLAQLRRLLAYAGPYRWHLAIAIVATLISSALALVFPRVVGQLVDALFVEPLSRGDSTALDQAVFNATQTYLLAYAGEGVVADLRRALYAHLLGLPVRFFESRKTGEITSRLTSDVARVQGTVSGSLAQLLSQTLTLLAGITI